jgi:hypothetical protein
MGGELEAKILKYSQTDVALSIIAPPSVSSLASLWTEIPCYAVLRFTATLDKPPYISMKQTVAIYRDLTVYCKSDIFWTDREKSAAYPDH